MRKPEVRPTINRLNAMLNKLLAQGIYSYAECVHQRGQWARLLRRKRK